MILKVGQFRVNKVPLIEQVKRYGIESISFYCACSAIPVAAAVVYCLEEFPEHKELLESKLQVLREFYGYEAIEE